MDTKIGYPLSLWVVSLVLTMPLQVLAAGGHGDHKGARASLLSHCQGASVLPSPDCGRTPTAVFGADSRLWLVFSQNGHIYLTVSDDLGKAFTPPNVVNRVPELISDDGENRPKLVLGEKGEVYVSWTRKTPGRYTGDVRFARSLDAGRHFDDPITVNDDRSLISHRFDSMVKDSQGRLYISWLDKRDLAAAKAAGQAYAGAAVYFAVSKDRGASFGTNRKLVDHSCECCRIAMDVDRDDRVVTLWRHVYPVNLRDHAIARLTESTPPLAGEPVRATDDGWQVDGCPHHGPDLSLSRAGKGGDKAHMTWFTRGEKNRGLMYGRFDLEAEQLDFQQSIDPSAGASRPQVLALSDRIWRAWKRFDGTQTLLMTSSSADEGVSWSELQMLAITSDASDHPDLISHEDRVFVSWHTLAEGYRLIPLTKALEVARHED